MIKITKKLAALLTAITLCLVCVPTGSAVTVSEQKNSLSPLAGAKLVDGILEHVVDPLLCSIVNTFMNADHLIEGYPTAEEYFEQEHPYFYEGTNGTVSGEGWKLGYDRQSVIPCAWRLDKDSNPSSTGMNLNKSYYFGGYFGSKVNKIYDDETVNLSILTCGSDSNGNGVEDILIIASLDNIGMSNGNVRKVREAVADKLASLGVESDDIIAFEFNCTHAHTVIEALGMSLNTVFTQAIKNRFGFKKDTSVAKELLDTICEKTAEAAANAYTGMSEGTLYYFDTVNVNDYADEYAVNKTSGEKARMIRDKLGYGAAFRPCFGCFYFEADNGEKTVLANIGTHPTFAGRSSERLCADFPYYFNLAMQSLGYNLIFIQGSQAAIGTSGYYTEEAKNWADENTLSYETWAERYGKDYADENYNDAEKDYWEMRAVGYTFAQIVTSSIENKTEVEPTLDVKMEEAVMPLDYGIMYLGAVSGVFGSNTVRTTFKTESGYSVVTEIGYVKFGSGVAMLMLPGEVSPAITYGKSEEYTGSQSWSGSLSFTGKDWEYKTLEEMAKEALGNDTVILAMGLANEELGYIMPDTDCAKNFLTKTILASSDNETASRADNEELMSASPEIGSSLVNAYAELFGVSAK